MANVRSVLILASYSILSRIKFINNSMFALLLVHLKMAGKRVKEFFPPNFFLPARNGGECILTVRNSDKRIACNEYHRLSQFLIKNSVEMKKSVPGIFLEIIHILAGERGYELISHINELLKSLMDYPKGLFCVTEDLFLSDADLIGNEYDLEWI